MTEQAFCTSHVGRGHDHELQVESRPCKCQDFAETTDCNGQYSSLSSQYLPISLLGGANKKHPGHRLILKHLVEIVLHFFLKAEVSHCV